ncbi:MAG: hypothetical protein ISS25_01660 [Nanoarchaeota archaeon]|nr:hypothetical protein [DPANN group archaeon]MBL7116516.1 hypothetical protein [Nanoarchaeota archaeon]
MSLSTLVVTKSILDWYYPSRHFYTSKSAKWHVSGVASWVEDYIKFFARFFRRGESIDKIIDWVDPKTKKEGNHFENLDVFLDSMHIASKVYGVSSPYKKFRFMTLPEANQILSEYNSGATANELVRKYELYNKNVVYNLERDLGRQTKRFFSVLKGLEQKKIVDEHLDKLVDRVGEQPVIVPEVSNPVHAYR